MVRKFKKTCLIVSSLLACSGLAYSEDSPQVVSQGGPLGATSIGDQNLGQPDPNASGASSTTQTTGSNLNDRELLLKLQQQVQQLQGQLQQLKAQGNGGGLQNTSNGSSQFTTYSSKVDGNKNPRTLGGNGESKDLSQALIGGQTSSDIMGNVNASNSIINLASEPLGGVFNQKGGIDVGGAPAITTQGQVTYLGSYSGNNSIPIGQISSNLFASTLLGQREKFDDYSVFFGGFIEADAQAWFGSAVTKAQSAGQLYNNGQNIYLTSANLYFLSNLGHYVTAQFDFDTNESGSFSLGNAFVIFGNLDTTPVFVSVGKYRPSVGSFGGGGPWTSGITANMFRPLRVTNAAINYRGDTSNANFTVFDAKNHATFSVAYFDAVSIPNIAQVGFNLGYMHDIRGANNRFNFIDKRVGEFNIDTAISFESIPFLPGNLNVGAGWATTTTQSTQFNGRSNAFAGAFTVQAAYTFKLFGSGQNINASYGHSYNADNIPMPLSAGGSFFLAASGIKDQILVSTQRSFFDDNVLIGPEYSWQSLYNGQRMNTLTLDLSVYI
ncbi:DUF3573 domain-containing protein [Francisella tularensis]|uniref:DUF3573 domain-containing protein n=1 Tax=Francisella tularensis TaxID=263 RepID=UPI00138E7603|nr:DUF3573 domain-containing protein [Francisella tularensis]QHV77702.1 DUF3573 domain-containing protein [Francisella tularensis subsp. holarctica]QHV79292.1 DUF3573 domain-containing protein [Francisella tularensis subsp. holarctica]